MLPSRERRPFVVHLDQPMYHLHLLDGLALEGPAGPVSGRAVQRRQLALLALLGASGDTGLSRDRIIGLLWPESDEARARHLLRDSLYHLRRELGEDAVLPVGEAVRLNPEVVWCDVSAFRSALERGALEEAVDHYRGPFLHGFHVRDTPGYEHWADSERQRLAAQYEEALESLAKAADQAGDYPQAVSWWRRLAAHDRYNSRFVVSLMGALAAAGDPANAAQLAAEHEVVLREELGEEAATQFRVLAEQVKFKGFSARVELRDDLRDPAPSSAPPAARETEANGPEAQPGAKVATDRRATATEVAEVLGAHDRQYGRWSKAQTRLIAGTACLAALAVIVWVGVTVLAGHAPALDDYAIAIIPFEGNSSDEEVTAIQSAVPILLEPMIESSGRYHAVPHIRATDALRASRLAGLVELGADDLQSLGMVLGARYLIAGNVTGVDQTQVVTVRLLDVASGEQLTVVRATPGEAGVLGLIDDLYVGLSLHLAGEGARADLFFGTDPQAVDDYVAGIEASRRGDYAIAERRFASAMERDTTFALAAAQIMDRGSWWTDQRADEFGVWAGRAREIARANMHRLPAPERAVMVAFLSQGNVGVREVLQNWRRAVEASPDNGVAIGRYGDFMLHDGGWAGFPDHIAIATAMFDSLAALGIDWNETSRHRDELRLLAGDTAFAKTLLEEHPPTADDFRPEVWLAAQVANDTAAQERMRSMIPTLPFARELLPVMHFGIWSGLGLDDADRAAEAGIASLPRLFEAERGRVLGEVALYSFNRGRPRLALEYLDQLYGEHGNQPADSGAESVDVSHANSLLTVALWAPEGWPLSDSLEVLVRNTAERLPSSEDDAGYHDGQEYRMNLECLLGLYHLDQLAEFDRAELDHRRSLEAYTAFADNAGRRGQPFPAHYCGELLHAALATVRGDQDALEELSRLDRGHPPDLGDALSPGLGGGFWIGLIGANLTLARAFARLGEYERALAALERRRFLAGPYPFYSTTWLLRARYLRELHRYEESAVAYSRYLQLVSDPEPRVQVHVESVRRELAEVAAR